MLIEEKMLRKINEEKDVECSKKIKEYIDFIEMIEAITTDKYTAKKIREFLENKDIWKKTKQ
jgi:hypothetical protein